jgi:hypothetical protein
MDEPLERFRKGWPAIKKAPWHFTGCVVFVGILLWAAMCWRYDAVIDGRDAALHAREAELAQKGETVRTISEERDKANRENEKLVKQIESLRIYRGQDAPPLKRKALILAQQIKDYTKDWKDTDSPDVQNDTVFNYIKRFGLRAQIIRDDLDQNGQQSDTFDKVMYNFGYNYKDVRTIADEIETLAKRLPD